MKRRHYAFFALSFFLGAGIVLGWWYLTIKPMRDLHFEMEEYVQRAEVTVAERFYRAAKRHLEPKGRAEYEAKLKRLRDGDRAQFRPFVADCAEVLVMDLEDRPFDDDVFDRRKRLRGLLYSVELLHEIGKLDVSESGARGVFEFLRARIRSTLDTLPRPTITL